MKLLFNIQLYIIIVKLLQTVVGSNSNNNKKTKLSKYFTKDLQNDGINSFKIEKIKVDESPRKYNNNNIIQDSKKYIHYTTKFNLIKNNDADKVRKNILFLTDCNKLREKENEQFIKTKRFKEKKLLKTIFKKINKNKIEKKFKLHSSNRIHTKKRKNKQKKRTNNYRRNIKKCIKHIKLITNRKAYTRKTNYTFKINFRTYYHKHSRKYKTNRKLISKRKTYFRKTNFTYRSKTYKKISKKKLNRKRSKPTSTKRFLTDRTYRPRTATFTKSKFTRNSRTYRFIVTKRKWTRFHRSRGRLAKTKRSFTVKNRTMKTLRTRRTFTKRYWYSLSWNSRKKHSLAKTRYRTNRGTYKLCKNSKTRKPKRPYTRIAGLTKRRLKSSKKPFKFNIVNKYKSKKMNLRWKRNNLTNIKKIKNSLLIRKPIGRGFTKPFNTRRFFSRITLKRKCSIYTRKKRTVKFTTSYYRKLKVRKFLFINRTVRKHTRIKRTNYTHKSNHSRNTRSFKYTLSKRKLNADVIKKRQLNKYLWNIPTLRPLNHTIDSYSISIHYSENY
ncbi:uncharacterized protein LOC142329837 [Lycorma delicatula]|uniref:uncharacterized protein LOC142329837 n=1 Tax=Lycorma delicatula TaxID=130591 RepID=UPI003F51A78C